MASVTSLASRRRRARVVALAVVCGAGALGAVACSTPQLDAAKVEEAIRAETSDVEFDEVVCPAGIAAQDGGTFECVATGGNGTRVIVTVTQQGEAGDVRLAFGRGIVQTATVGSMLDADVEATLEAEVELRCPAAVLLADNSGAFTCDGVDEGGDRFRISVRVDDGKVAPDGWDLVE